MSKESLVYPGRFQPFTLGHLTYMEWILGKYKPGKVVVAFPENKERSRDNPFLAAETGKIIELSLGGLEVVEVRGVKMELYVLRTAV